MKNSYSEVARQQNNIYTRKFGGTMVGVADPYVSGYFFIWFNDLPSALGPVVQDGLANVGDPSEMKSILAGSCTGVTPPGGTLNKIEFTGLGGVKWSVPGSIDYGTSVTLKFIEFNKTPVFDIIHGWCKLIRDYRLGVSAKLYDDFEGDGYSKSTYAGTLYYWTTAPDGFTVEYYACYDGVFPTKDPQDLFASDIENVAKLDIEVEFNVDYIYHEPWVLTKCESLMTTFMTSRETVLDYGSRIS